MLAECALLGLLAAQGLGEERVLRCRRLVSVAVAAPRAGRPGRRQPPVAPILHHSSVLHLLGVCANVQVYVRTRHRRRVPYACTSHAPYACTSHTAHLSLRTG